MRPIRSTVDPQEESYRSNYAANTAAVERLRSELARSTRGGGEQYVKRHLARGKLLPRERIEMLIDEGTWVQEEDGLLPADPLGFVSLDQPYASKVAETQAKTGLEEAILTGTGRCPTICG